MADQEQNGGRSIELTQEVLDLAENYLDTCKDSYRRFDEVAEDENMESLGEGGREELYEEARDIVREAMQGSVSLLQRKLRIGYSRASKLMDLLEEHSVVAPADGAKPRALLSEDQEREYLAAITDPEEKRASKKLYRFNPHYRQHVELPSIAGLAIHLQVSRQTIYNWKEEETELGKRFFDITEKVLAEQERRLVDNGLSGTYNPTIAKLILGKHGYTDKIDHTTGDKPIQASPEAQALAANAIDTYLNGTRNETTTDTTGATGE